MKKLFLLAGFCAAAITTLAQEVRMSSTEIQRSMQRLSVVGNVMYLAAHPDDENTRMIAWLTQHGQYRTSYLSLTRGDGGQNRIGTEQGAALGVLRSQELMAARSIDQAEQYFTRAVDFGYSKSVGETFEFWNQDTVLSDVVRAIRQFKPDVIITRFPPDKRAGHGHHTASAVLAELAFDAAADSTQFTESYHLYGTWQPTRLYFNTSRWFDAKWIDAHLDELIEVNVGDYDAIRGEAYTERAARARSQHRCQAFGTAPVRGDLNEYLQYVKGDSVTNQDIFQNIDASWNRTEGGKNIAKSIAKMQKKFNPSAPWESADALLAIRAKIAAMPANNYQTYKLQEVDRLLEGMLGLWAEYLADAPETAVTTQTKTSVRVVNQGKASIELNKVTFAHGAIEVGQSIVNTELILNDSIVKNKITPPYWLKDPAVNNFYTVENREDIGQPFNDPIETATFYFTVNGEPWELTKPLRYKYTDRSIGQRYHNPVMIPEITAHFEQEVQLFPNDGAKEITVTVTAQKELSQIKIKPIVPKGWQVQPALVPVETMSKGEVTYYSFKVIPPAEKSEGYMEIQVVQNIPTELRDLQYIDYTHIEKQVLMPTAHTWLAHDKINVAAKKVAYIMGAGDKVPAALNALGIQVDVVKLDQLTLEQLVQYDAVVAGIRLYNVQDVGPYQGLINAYIEQGGRYIVQYSTSYSQKSAIAPFELTLSRERVTDEHSAVTFLVKDHPVLKYPNTIMQSDFEGWVQERGLYFAGEWNEAYTPIIGWHDKGEERVDGGLLIAQYGKGWMVYTGISFFRELPAGITGAYKLMSNLLSLPIQTQPEN